MNDTIPEQVLTVLSTVEIDNHNVRITAQLDRKLYLAVNKVLDRIIMNPPFSPKQADIDHVTAAYGLLAPGGILVTIMSAGALFRENKKTVEFREMIMEPHGTYLDRLPAGAFRESGTMVNTILLRLEK